MYAQNINQVIQQLNAIIYDAYIKRDRSGYFAALYLKVTRDVRKQIQAGNYFEDGDWMEELDVIFANRYLTALRQLQEKQPMTATWQVALGATQHSNYSVVQQLIASCTAHIGLDLPLAVIELSNGQLDERIHRDFDRLNPILSSLVPKVSAEIDKISPLLGAVDRTFSFLSNAIIDYSMDIARGKAWDNVQWISSLPVEQRVQASQQLDQSASVFAQEVLHPGLFTPVMAVVSLFEQKDVRKVIDDLMGDTFQEMGYFREGAK